MLHLCCCYDIVISLADSDASDSDSNDDDDSDDDVRGAVNSEYADLVRGDPEVLLAQIRSLDEDLSYSITWVQRSLNRAAGDREDGIRIIST